MIFLQSLPPQNLRCLRDLWWRGGKQASEVVDGSQISMRSSISATLGGWEKARIKGGGKKLRLVP